MGRSAFNASSHCICACESPSAGVLSGFWTTWWPTKMLTWWKNLGMCAHNFLVLHHLLAYILYLGIIRTFLKMVVAKFYTSMYLMITVCCLIKIILISFSAVTFFNKDNQMTVMSNCVSNHNVKISSMTILAICLCTAYTGQRWWSSSSSPRTCLSCRWRWMCTLLWKRYLEKLQDTLTVPSDLFLRALYVISFPCSGCFCSSIHRGTAQSSSF